MAEFTEHWKIFRSWELEVCRQSDPTHLITALITDLRQEWNKIESKVEYADALQELKDSVRNLERERRRVKVRQGVIDKAKAQNSALILTLAAVRAYEDLLDKLLDYVGCLVVHAGHLRLVRRNQTALNTAGEPSGNERSRRYTVRLLEETRTEINDVQLQLRDCKQWLESRRISTSSDGSSSNASLQDEGEGGRTNSRQADRNRANSAHDTNGTKPSQSSQGVTAGGASGGGVGAGGSGGSDGSGGEERHLPPSKLNARESDDDDEDSSEESDSKQAATGSKGTPGRVPEENFIAFVDEDDGDAAGPDEDDQLDFIPLEGDDDDEEEDPEEDKELDFIPLEDDEEEEEVEDEAALINGFLGSEHEYLLDNLPGVVNQQAGNLNQQQHRSDRRVDPGQSLPDYSEVMAQERLEADMGSRSMQISQVPGASQNSSQGNNRDGRMSSRQRNRESAPKVPLKGIRMAAGTPDDPDGESSSSSSESGGKRTPSKRSAKDGDEGEDRGNARGESSKKRQKKTSEDPLKAGPPGLDAQIAAMAKPARDYCDTATGPECIVALENKRIADFAERLYRAYGEHIWAMAGPLEAYFNADGTERSSSERRALEKAEFDQAWRELLSNLSGPEKATWEGLHKRLLKAEAWLVPPGIEHLYGFRLRVIEAEHPRLHKRWQEHEAHIKALRGSAAGIEVQAQWAEMLKQKDQNNIDLREPEHTPPLDPKDGPLPGPLKDNSKLVIQKAQHLGFDQVAFPGHWTFVESLNIGGQGHAGLWVKYDSFGRIIERKVVKETYLTSDTWNDKRVWFSSDDRVPREYQLGFILSGCDEAFNIIGSSLYRLYPLQYMYRLYMEYCPHGDLQLLIQTHHNMSLNAVDQAGEKLTCFVPISVVWCVFEALASVACLMKDGHVPEDETVLGWDSIYHRDIKPLNVFLDPPHHLVWKAIPEPRLGDFGMAMEHTPTNVRPPSETSVGVGTPGYKAPEAEVYDPKLLIPKHPYTSAGDIFAIGQTMFALMSLRNPTQKRFDQELGLPELPYAAKAFYPQRLQDLMMACLQSKPDDRIKAEKLWLEIRNETGTSKGLRDVPLKFRGLGANEVLYCKPDLYKPWAR